jgi:tryptophan halogenase
MNIVIVGGGTAGWIAAYFISKSQPNLHSITVIESSKIGIIGAGEGSTGSLINLIEGRFFDSKIDLVDFMNKTDGTLKMGIMHRNWAKDKSDYFAPLDTSPTGFALNDYIFKYVFSKVGKEGMHISSKIGLNYNQDNTDKIEAVHFDGHKVGQYFKNICINLGVIVKDTVVEDISVDNNGYISYIITEDSEIISGDLFIDCTGFSRKLMKAINVDWISKQDVLPMNTAMPFLLNYSNGDEIFPFTTATALSSGWMWSIPLKTRMGCGYVFDSRFISKEEAKKEIEEYLQTDITPIKYIDFTSGYSEKFFSKNVLCLGLSSAFVEPLEATSIHNTIIQIAIFVNECLSANIDSTFSKYNKEIYNKRITFLQELTVDFISLHYQGGRDDTPFWKYIKDNKIGTPWALETVERARIKIPGYSSFEGMYGSFSIPLSNWIMAGLDIITPKQAEEDLISSGLYKVAEKEYGYFYNTFFSG